MEKVRTISLFCGSGGLDLGFLKNGSFDILLANDFNRWACESYRNNIGDHVVHGDIKELKDFPTCDLIIGGPPCQGFSTANPKRAFDDPRNWLFKEYARIITEAHPKVFLMENVSGLMTLDKGRVLNLIVSEFESLGYRVKYQLLNAVDYGVPQKRRRLIMVGVREDIDVVYQFPSPVVSPPMFGVQKTVQDALDSKLDGWDDPNDVISNVSPLNAKRLLHIPEGGAMKDVPVDLQNNSDLKRAMRRLSRNEPSPTIVHNNCDHYYHPTENRRVTIREMALIQTYPPDYVFAGSKSEQSRQVGNSVPVELAYHLADSIEALFETVDMLQDRVEVDKL